MKSYAFVHELLSLLEDFEKENEREITLPDFVGFLLIKLSERNGLSNRSEVRFGNSEPNAQDIAFNIDNNISRLLIFMYRYAKSYIKKALDGTPLQTAEDFTCLAILLTHDSISKTELIRHNILEKTSGTAVIARLIAAGLVDEWQNKSDKRGKHIAITPKGRELLYKVFEHTSNVGTIVTGKLSLNEKLTLQYLLQKLEEFHYPIHVNRMVSSQDDLNTIAKTISK
ncbi:MarR family winged helix-turn-helix transcriptional regulator [Mucilaginibacter pedocola]|uniref:HTH marR-type domain-containing protein n=1 Tax=Mucilaginibacter pedocola TaxID=1792845 RepID=A0A1S9PHE3_9SPHI|nr:MarR family winged helix-turn-helix transcriptional regulator [Mucilaginibacter pedocola]OOQ60345.1 hypothetical protein BC343_25310 [Mucilaginibacter pedocola]